MEGSLQREDVDLLARLRRAIMHTMKKTNLEAAIKALDEALANIPEDSRGDSLRLYNKVLECRLAAGSMLPKAKPGSPVERAAGKAWKPPRKPKTSL